jgi:transcriptional regulator with XRE-family HTH domain
MQNPRNMIGPQLRRIRNERSLSQPALAALLQRAGWDISRDTVAKIEDQRRWVSDFEVAFLAEILKVPISHLLEVARGSEKSKGYIRRLERVL